MRKKQFRGWLLLLVILALLITGLVAGIKNRLYQEPEGSYIKREDAYLLYSYLFGTKEDLEKGSLSYNGLPSLSQNGAEGEQDAYLTLKETEIMFSLLREQYPVYEGELEKLGEEAFPGNKREASHILAEEYFSCFQELFALLHGGETLTRKEGVLLGAGERIRNLDDSLLPDGTLLLAVRDEVKEASGIEMYRMAARLLEHADPAQENLYLTHVYYCTGDLLLFDLSAYGNGGEENAFVLQTCWISSNQPEQLWITTGGYQISIKSTEVKKENGERYDAFEDVADLYFAGGGLDYLVPYDKKVSGKLLSVSDTRIELEGLGFFEYDEALSVYKLYGNREPYSKKDLKIGYDFADFVLDQENRIVAGLVTREEKMDSIRVVIKTTGFSSAYHDQITFTCDTDFLVNKEKHLAGEEITVGLEDERLKDGRIYIRPSTNLARTTIQSIERDQGVPSYRGNFEIAKGKEGLILVNELLLEEYLYSVVPSEMPASYPVEALKAQAVCARSYAYERMLTSGIKEYGAHVDDSAAFQVYNNIQESESTTLAIRETQGQIITREGKIASTYYYSTSCGYGTDINAWHGSNSEAFSYMVSRHITAGEAAGDAPDGEDAPDMAKEEAFRAYIGEAHPGDYEAAEGWYRWRYETKLDIDRLNDNLLKRYEASSKNVLIPAADGGYVSGRPPVFTCILRMEVVKRGSGGVMDELLLQGAEGSVKITGEHNIRSVLANEGSEVVRQDGSKSAVSTLLPSAFGVIDVTMDEDGRAVTAYTVTGGGYGHGIGMSQNGAKSMAAAGLGCKEILTFFFEGIEISGINEEV